MKAPPSEILPFLLLASILLAVASCKSQLHLRPAPSPPAQTSVNAQLRNQDNRGAAGNATHPFDSLPFDQLSGITYHPQRGSLFAVEGKGRVIEFKADGTFVRRKRIRKRADLEGIGCNPATGQLYVAIEGKDVILEVDPDSLEVVRDIPIDRMFEGELLLAPERKGIEGITYVPADSVTKSDTFYLVNQSDELSGMDASLVVAVEVRSDAEETRARTIDHFSVGVTDLSGIHYMPSSRRLLVLSDANDLLLVVSLSGEVVETHPVPGSHQEGIAVGPDGTLYVAQDRRDPLLMFRPNGADGSAWWLNGADLNPQEP